MGAPAPFLHALKDSPEKPGTRDQEKPEEEATDGKGDILCRACGFSITSRDLRTTRNNSHIHTFANPHGHVFTIGCFAGAPGCGHPGPDVTEFTWFPGFAWRLAVCGKCLAHLGWLFTGTDSSFYGLVLDALIEQSSSV